MTADLLALATATSGGTELWNTLSGLRIDISVITSDEGASF
jgi:hypothetical protein